LFSTNPFKPCGFFSAALSVEQQARKSRSMFLVKGKAFLDLEIFFAPDNLERLHINENAKRDMDWFRV
jgi:hypothetical protein